MPLPFKKDDAYIAGPPENTVGYDPDPNADYSKASGMNPATNNGVIGVNATVAGTLAPGQTIGAAAAVPGYHAAIG